MTLHAKWAMPDLQRLNGILNLWLFHRVQRALCLKNRVIILTRFTLRRVWNPLLAFLENIVFFTVKVSFKHLKFDCYFRPLLVSNYWAMSIDTRGVYKGEGAGQPAPPYACPPEGAAMGCVCECLMSPLKKII